MTSRTPVVVTGTGIVSPSGLTKDVLWESLINQVSGVGVREEFADAEHPYRIAAEVNDFEAKAYVKPRKSIKVMCRPIQFGFAASWMAIEDAGIKGQIEPERLSTVFGTEAFYADPNEVARVFRKCIVDQTYDHSRWGEFAMREIQPLWMLKYLPNMVASHISIACDARGPSNTICQSEVSSLLAIIEGVDLIQRGVADAVIVGGTGSLMATTGMIYRGLHRLSNRIAHPEQASRPFDKDRDGMVAGEGAAAFILERESFATARGARPIARILSSSRGYFDRDEQFPSALSQNLNDAVSRSGLSASEIGHVNAHGFSTVNDDIDEAQAIRDSMADTPVIAPKSVFGNLGPGTGAIELAASIQAGRHGILPATMNLNQIDDRCPINLVAGQNQTTNNPNSLCLNFTETGQMASLVVASEKA